MGHTPISNTITPSPRAYSIPQMAEQLGVSAGLLRLEIARGKLRPTRLGRRVLITDDEASRYLKEQTQ
jgi:excisionase family DNA binding protein